MIDTLGCKAIIDYETYEKIKKKTLLTQRIDKETGEVEFEYDNGQTKHSHNYKVVYKISDEYWTSDKPEDSDEIVASSKRIRAIKKTGIPHVKLEFSIPKILWGHNLHSAGMALIYDAMHIVKQAFEEKYESKLPLMHEWYCYRLDTCANYILANEQPVRNYINYLSKLDYPRREPIRYGDSGIYFPSRQNTLKIYAKGPEFKDNDKKRFLDTGDAKDLYDQAKRILRLEVEHKLRIRYLTHQYNKQFEDISEDKGLELYVKYLKHQIDRLNEEKLSPSSSPEKIDKEITRIRLKLKKIDERTMMFERDLAFEEMRIKTFEGYPQIMNLIDIFDCKTEMENVMGKLLSGTSSRVLQSLAVENIIRKGCRKRQASTFIAVYYSIINQDQAYAKEAYERNIYYRALKVFRELGISLIAGETVDPADADMGFPADFRLDIDESNPYYQLPTNVIDEAVDMDRAGEAF